MIPLTLFDMHTDHEMYCATTNIYRTYVLVDTHNAFAHARNEIFNQNTLQPKTAKRHKTLFQKFDDKETTTNICAKMAPPNDHYRAERHHHFHKMQNRNGVGRNSNFRNQRKRGWNGNTGRVSSATLSSDSVNYPFLTLMYFLMQDYRKEHHGERHCHPHHQHSYWREEPRNTTHQATILPPHEKKINPSGVKCTAKPRFVAKSMEKKEEEDVTMVGSNAITEKKRNQERYDKNDKR